MKHITLIAGARPNFMKIAPLIHAIIKARKSGVDIAYRLVHTGQHDDKQMSDTFFEELNIPTPDANLGCGGGSQAEQTAAIMVAFEKELMENPTDLVLVVGDVPFPVVIRDHDNWDIRHIAVSDVADDDPVKLG